MIDSAALDEAARRLDAGEVIVYPTETYYALGARIDRPQALERLLALKGDRRGQPISVLVADLAMLRPWVREIPPVAMQLIARHWPGPLTLVLDASAAVPEAVAAGTGTLGARRSPDPTARALLDRVGAPVTAPSANPSGAPPADTAEIARRYFGDRVACYLDAGKTPGGAPSTLARIEGEAVRVLREGPIALESRQ